MKQVYKELAERSRCKLWSTTPCPSGKQFFRGSLGAVLGPMLHNTFASVMDSGSKSTPSKSASDIWLHGAVNMLQRRDATGGPGQAQVCLCEHEVQQ